MEDEVKYKSLIYLPQKDMFKRCFVRATESNHFLTARAEIHQDILSQFCLLQHFLFGKMPAKEKL
jgi:hypothetical protein